MNWLAQMFSSTLGRKLVMSLTGLFLITFLIVHLTGNLQLLKDDDGEAFNVYAHFMTTNPLIKAASYILYAGILIHVIWSIILTAYNAKARPVKYAVSNPSANSPWTSRNMGILGTIILIFLVIHLQGFWYRMKFGEMPMVTYAGIGEYRDLYLVVNEAFSQWWIVVIYVLSMLGLAFHLAHGFQSAFQTLGINHKKYTPFIQKVGLAFSVIVPGMFAMLPIIMFIKSMA